MGMGAIVNFVILCEEDMVAFGARLGQAMACGIIYLVGDLGTGKTTLCRGIMRGRGFTGAVKSPTYTLVEPYDLPSGRVSHFDLYRLRDPEELEYMGIRDYFHEDSLCVIEWPEKGEGLLPAADLNIGLRVEGTGRVLSIMALSPRGQKVLNYLESDAPFI